MVSMFGSGGRARTAPSHYPRVAFHTLRLIQLVSSIVVGGIMIYFIDALRSERPSPTTSYDIPRTFVFLLSASLLSIAALLFTMVMHCCVGLNPRLNLIINGGLSILWAGSWSVLTWWTRQTLAGFCSTSPWGAGAGMMICQLYKALFSFALFGFLSTLAAFCLDVYVRRRQTRSGIYRLHDIDNGHERKTSAQAFPTGLQFAPLTQPQQGYMQPEGQYRYNTAYEHGYNH